MPNGRRPSRFRHVDRCLTKRNSDRVRQQPQHQGCDRPTGYRCARSGVFGHELKFATSKIAQVRPAQRMRSADRARACSVHQRVPSLSPAKCQDGRWRRRTLRQPSGSFIEKTGNVSEVLSQEFGSPHSTISATGWSEKQRNGLLLAVPQGRAESRELRSY